MNTLTLVRLYEINDLFMFVDNITGLLFSPSRRVFCKHVLDHAEIKKTRLLPQGNSLGDMQSVFSSSVD